MLNKDQYNEEEYNDYYRQEVEGAELSDFEEEEEGNGLLSKLILLLVLIALSIAGYFGYKVVSDNNENDNESSLEISLEESLPQSIQKEVEQEPTREKQPENVNNKEVVKKAEVDKNIQKQPTANVQDSVTSKVTEAVKKEGQMSPEEVASVVAVVMQKINQQKKSEAVTSSTTTKKEDKLVTELSDSEVDSVSADLIKELENININKDTEIDTNNKHIDTYNKVNVQNNTGSDSLSELSNKITNLMSEETTKSTASANKVNSYTNSLKSEVSVRKNEMRIIVVKKGDTLGKIAERAYGNAMDYQKIYKANPELTRPDRIYIGQKLRIPN